MADKYTQAFARDVREETIVVDGKKVTRIRFKGVLKYREENPDFKEPPEGEDTRKPSEKRRYVWRQVAKALTCPKGRGKNQTENNVNDALEEWRQEMERAERGEDEPEVRGMTVYEVVTQFITTRTAAGVIEPSTTRDYLGTARRLEPFFSQVHVNEMQPKDAQQWEAEQLQKGVSALVVGKCHRLLKSALKWAVRQEYAERNVMEAVEPPKRPKATPNSLDQADMQRLTGILLDASPCPSVVGAMLALHAGLRAGECVGLKWRDVDLESRELHINRSVGVGDKGTFIKSPKTESSLAAVPFDEDLAEVLQARREVMQAEVAALDVTDIGFTFDELYVLGNLHGDYMHPYVLSRKWGDLAEEHRLIGTQGRRVCFHDLRHSYVSAQVWAGQDISNVASNARHASTSMTLDVYASPSKEGKRRSSDALGDYMRPIGRKPRGETLELRTGTTD